MNHSIPKGITALAATLLLSGCIHSDVTVQRDVERAKVEFENDAAARIFYETLSKDNRSQEKRESTTEVSLPIIFEHKRHVVTGGNVVFNQAVEQCDTNRDGRITEQEARIFAEQRAKAG